jgi:uncharacterized protein (TIRG00374 family)
VKKRVLNILKYLAFLAAGVAIFWWIYKDIEMDKIVDALKHVRYHWIVVSIFFGLMSQVSRAIRWNMLIRPLGYNPRFHNTFLSVLVLYLFNLFIPRSGEVARCTVLSRYEKVPFSKLVGTVVVERMADTVTLGMLAIIILASQFRIFSMFFNKHPEIKNKIVHLFSGKNIAIGLVAILLLIIILVLSKKILRNTKLVDKLREIRINFIEGIKTIARLENVWLFVGHTLFIFLMWLLMLYVVFLAYPPTEHLSIWTGMVAFLMGGLAMLAPVQGGIGPWHFMVIHTLAIYGVHEDIGAIFALIAHTATNLIYLVFGTFALILLPFVNKNK